MMPIAIAIIIIPIIELFFIKNSADAGINLGAKI
jgi:uncharacterized membrane protein